MLRDLANEDPTRCLRKGEIDPNDSVFVVLLWYEKDDRTHHEIGSVWLGKGEAAAAAERYQREGSVAFPAFIYATVLEIQTGQLAPKGERHGDPYLRVTDAPKTEADEMAALRLEINRLRAQIGQNTSTTVLT